jgi:ribosomal protein S18 acetylase RimI-like enzyme
VGFNRAFDVDARDPASVKALAAALRNAGRRALLEIAPISIGEIQRRELAAARLAKLWTVVTLRCDLGAIRPEVAHGVVVRGVAVDEADRFGLLAARSYEMAEAEALWSAYARVALASCYIAEMEGVPTGVGFMCCWGDDAFLDGAATLPEYRQRGCQTALLAHRLREARALGARGAFSRTGEGSLSQRNLERAGFRVIQRMEVWGDRSA